MTCREHWDLRDLEPSHWKVLGRFILLFISFAPAKSLGPKTRGCDGCNMQRFGIRLLNLFFDRDEISKL